MALGHPSVAHAQGAISSREFGEWLAYDRLSPIGPERGDWHAALIAAVLANVFRGKGHRPFTIEDFMPEFDKGQGPKTVKEMAAMLTHFAKMHNARIAAQKRKGKK